MTAPQLLRLFGLALQDRAFYAVVLASAAQYLIPYGVQRTLLARLDPERRARAWNGLTWACAILWIGPLSMIPFCFVTRPVPEPEAPLARRAARGAIAVAVGVAWAAALTAASVAVEYAITRALGVDLSPAPRGAR